MIDEKAEKPADHDDLKEGEWRGKSVINPKY